MFRYRNSYWDIESLSRNFNDNQEEYAFSPEIEQYSPRPSFPDFPDFPDNEGRHKGNKPMGSPPRGVPEKPSSLRRIEAGAIRGCLYNYTYVWLTNGSSFWFYPTFIGRESISGYRFTRRGWVYLGFDLRMIESFYCAG